MNSILLPFSQPCLCKCIVGEVEVAFFAPARQGTCAALTLATGFFKYHKLLISENLPWTTSNA
jgi:hypothetical protein